MTAPWQAKTARQTQCGAIDDGVAAYRDLLEHGTPAEQIVLAGDSAGGGLSIMTVPAAHDASLPRPAGVIAFSPGVDATRSGESMTTKDGIDPLFTRQSLERLGAHYLASQDPRQPLLSPAVLADLSEPPPLLLQAGSNEVLLDDSTRLATWAAAAGVDVILDVTADVPHVFQSFTGSLDEADAALDRAGRFIIDRLASAPAAAAPPDAGEDVRRRLAGDDVPAHHGAHRGRGIRGAGREPGAAMVGCTYRIRWDRAEIVRSTASP